MSSTLLTGPCQGVLSPAARSSVRQSLRRGASLLVAGTAGDGQLELAEDLARDSTVPVRRLWDLELHDEFPLVVPSIVLGTGATALTSAGAVALARIAERLTVTPGLRGVPRFWEPIFPLVVVMEYDPLSKLVATELIALREYFERSRMCPDSPTNLGL